MGSHTTGRAPLAGELGQHRDLRPRAVHPGDRRAAARDRCDGDLGCGVDRAEKDHSGLRAEIDPSHPASGTPLRPHRRCGKVQELRLRSDEKQIICLGGLAYSHHGVPRLERDDLELGPVGPVSGSHTLDHALPGADSDGISGSERDEREHPLLLGVDREVVGDPRACGELDRALRRNRQVHRRETDEAAERSDRADL